MTATLHISSIVVTADPRRVDQVVETIEAIDMAEVPVQGPAGKLIVTLESDSESAMVETLNTIQLLPGVASAALVYHQTTTDAAASAAVA